MKNILLMLPLLGLFGCSSIKSMYNKAEVHEKIIVKLDQEGYSMDLDKLFKKVCEFADGENVEGKWVYVSSPGFQDRQTMDKINEYMEEGFFYKGKLYATKSKIDSFFEIEKALSGKLDTGNYHILEKNKGSFLVVKGNTLFEGKSVGSNKSSIKISKLTGIIRPITIDFDWWKILEGKGLIGGFKSLPVDFEDSKKYAEKDKASELTFFFFADKDRAEKMENSLQNGNNT